MTNLWFWWEDVIEDEVLTEKMSAVQVSLMKNDHQCL